MGAGPAGLFAAFQLGLFNIRSIIVDGRPKIGGQCTAFYADKLIFDAPGFSSILSADLIDGLREQLASASPVIMLERRVAAINWISGEQLFTAQLADGLKIRAQTTILAGGGGAVDTLPMLDGHQIDDLVNVDPSTFSAGRTNVFAIGDAASYPGKLRLILSAFHEAALATQAIRKALSENTVLPRARVKRRRGR